MTQPTTKGDMKLRFKTRLALLITLCLPVTVSAFEFPKTEQMKKQEAKLQWLKKVAITNPVKHAALNLSDQVAMFDCRKPLSLEKMKNITTTKEFYNLTSAINTKREIIGIANARQILTKDLIKSICE